MLAWAAEHASPDECPILCQKWLALRPEERWWLSAKTAAEAAKADRGQRGWRKALYCALSDVTGITLRTKAKPKARNKDKSSDAPQDNTLFDFIEKGEI